jgi:hypothetical protein
MFPSARPARGSPAARSARPHPQPKRARRPMTRGPCTDADQAGEPARPKTLLQKHPQATREIPLREMPYSTRLPSCNQTLRLPFLYYDRVLGRPRAHRRNGTGAGPPSRATGQPPDASKRPTLTRKATCNNEQRWDEAGCGSTAPPRQRAPCGGGGRVPVSYRLTGHRRINQEHQRLTTKLPETIARSETVRAVVATCARATRRRTTVARPRLR